MSAITPKAATHWHEPHVRFVPEADIHRCDWRVCSVPILKEPNLKLSLQPINVFIASRAKNAAAYWTGENALRFEPKPRKL
jgi:hypothetical protein